MAHESLWLVSLEDLVAVVDHTCCNHLCVGILLIAIMSVGIAHPMILSCHCIYDVGCFLDTLTAPRCQRPLVSKWSGSADASRWSKGIGVSPGGLHLSPQPSPAHSLPISLGLAHLLEAGPPLQRRAPFPRGGLVPRARRGVRGSLGMGVGLRD